MSLNIDPSLPAHNFMRSTVFVAAISLALGLFVNYVTPVDVDELGSWAFSNSGPIEAYRRSVVAQGQAPLYFVLLSIWGWCFGWSPLALRGLSLVLLPFTAASLFRAGIWIGWGWRASLVSLLVLCSSPLWQTYTVVARPYALATFLMALLIFLWTCDRFNRRSVRFPVLVFLGSALFLTHYFFVAPFFVLILLLDRYRRESHGAHGLFPMELVAGGGGVLLGVVMVILPFSSHAVGLSELNSLDPPSFDFLRMHIDLLPVVPLVPIVMVWGLLRGRKLAEVVKHGGLEALAVLSLPLGLYLGSHLLSATILLPRYLSIAIVPSFLCVGRSLRSVIAFSPARTLLIALLQASILGTHFLSPLRMDRSANLVGYGELLASSPIKPEYLGCPLFAGSPFIESIRPERMSDPGLALFLRSAISYYEKGPYTLIPLGFQDDGLEREVLSSISRSLNETGCVRVLVAETFFWNVHGQFAQTSR